jgi:2-dehydro-3-deoxyphosphogluconate aldolase/(4S)-4-hydroxy-2-oxoglutarate aldolase
MTVADIKADHVTEQLARVRVVPVVVIDDAAAAAPLARALVDGGLPIAEVTFRTPAARDAIREMAGVDGMLVGAGTVLRPEQVDSAVQVGAQFIVSPGFSAAVVKAAQARHVPVISGVATATEIQMALDCGLELVKLFPAEAVGGLATVTALSAPFPSVRFIPTGGITEASAASYLAHPAVLAVGGSWMVAADLLAAGNFAAITQRAAAAVALAQSVTSERRSR